MKNERLLNAIGGIDDELVLGAEPASAGRRRGGAKWAAAACLAVVLLGGAVLLHNNSGELSPSADLPVLDIFGEKGAHGYGFEGYLAYDISELASGNPWTEQDAPKVLPVYRNPVEYDRAGAPVSEISDAGMEAMRSRALEAAERLGVEVEVRDNAPSEEEIAAVREKFGGEIPEGYFPPTEVTAEGVGVKIAVGADLAVRIDFDPAIDLPEGYNFHYFAPCQDMEKTANYLKEQYGKLLDMDKPQAEAVGGDYTFSGEQGYSIIAYDAAGSKVDRILNYNFNAARFSSNDEGQLWIVRLNRPDLSQKVGNYPLITAQEAEKLLCAGNYITTVPREMPGKEYIAKVELVYRTGRFDEYFMPYYLFYVEVPDMERDNGLKTFGAYYVPAVQGQYLSQMPVWQGQFN